MSDKEQKKSWGIVGGGILGMTLAYRLESRGYKVTLMKLLKAWVVWPIPGK